MSVHGVVQNGSIVLENGATLPEGTRVKVVLETEASDQTPKSKRSVKDHLMKFAGCMEGLPSDLAENHDHYLHGTPKR